MYYGWQYYNFDTKFFHLLYVTILNVEELNILILGFIREWPPSSTLKLTILTAVLPDQPRHRADFIWAFLQWIKVPSPQQVRKDLFSSVQKGLQPVAPCPKSKTLMVSVPLTAFLRPSLAERVDITPQAALLSQPKRWKTACLRMLEG